MKELDIPLSYTARDVLTVAETSDVKLSREQAGLEAKILSSASDSAWKNCPRPRPPAFVPACHECNAGTGNHCEFAMIIYQSYLNGVPPKNM